MAHGHCTRVTRIRRRRVTLIQFTWLACTRTGCSTRYVPCGIGVVSFVLLSFQGRYEKASCLVGFWWRRIRSDRTRTRCQRRIFSRNGTQNRAWNLNYAKPLKVYRHRVRTIAELKGKKVVERLSNSRRKSAKQRLWISPRR